jgi:flagellar protein FlbD
MIKVTRLNDSILMINVEMIQSVQATPDTVITFINRDKLMVKEPIEEISQRIVDYQRAVNSKYVPKISDVQDSNLPTAEQVPRS